MVQQNSHPSTLCWRAPHPHAPAAHRSCQSIVEYGFNAEVGQDGLLKLDEARGSSSSLTVRQEPVVQMTVM